MPSAGDPINPDDWTDELDALSDRVEDAENDIVALQNTTETLAARPRGLVGISEIDDETLTTSTSTVMNVSCLIEPNRWLLLEFSGTATSHDDSSTTEFRIVDDTGGSILNSTLVSLEVGWAEAVYLRKIVASDDYLADLGDTHTWRLDINRVAGPGTGGVTGSASVLSTFTITDLGFRPDP